MPYGLSGGASVRLFNSDKEELWAVGGGNGSAIPVTQVRVLDNVSMALFVKNCLFYTVFLYTCIFQMFYFSGDFRVAIFR